MATDGSFNVLASRNGKAIYSGIWGHVLANVRSTDLYPFIAGASGNSAGTAWVAAAADGLAEFSHSMMRFPNNSGYDQYAAVLPSASSQFPAGQDSFDGTWANIPIWVAKDTVGGTTTRMGLRGRFQDITVFPSSILWSVGGVAYPAGDGTPDSLTSPKWFAVGTYWFPTNTLVHI
jgi:hypothetical protein